MKFWITKWIVVSGLLLWVSGCSSMRVEPGMTRDQVQEALGAPRERTFQGKKEHWIYNGESPGRDRLIVFENDHVVGLLSGDPAKPLLQQADSLATSGAALQNRCVGENRYGKFGEGGGCNLYGCWPAGGYCNGFGCSSSGRCSVSSCPNKIDSYRCVD